MKRYRITKYNPQKRDEDGCFNGEEWTSIDDIGKTYEGNYFKKEEYLRIENAYIESIQIVMKEFNIDQLCIMDLEKKYELVEIMQQLNEKNILITEAEKAIYNSLSEGVAFEKNTVKEVIKLVLREFVWCQLYSPIKHFIIKFGYDYYMYITCNKLSTSSIKEIGELGLYVEEFELK